jgi:O-antigen ligase
MAEHRDPEINNPTRKVAFYSALALIFLRYSLWHEVLASVTGTSVYLLYLFGIPAAFGLVGSGGLRRTWSTTQVKYWFAFVVWLLLSVPFSTWKGQSTTYAMLYLRTDVPMLFFTAGLALTWKECRLMVATIGLAGICNIAVAFLIARSFNGRMGLEFGVVSNPNDYAAHLLFVLPLIAFLVICPPRLMVVKWPLRIAGIGALGLGIYIVLATGSRGAMIALVAGAAYILWKSSAKVRVAAVFALPLVGILLFAGLSEPVRNRLKSLTTGDASNEVNGPEDEAEESGKLRRFLLEESVRITIHRPLFGVGPGQFGNYEGKAAQWRSTHNSFTQISSETGIPGAVFFLCGVISSFVLMQRTWRQTRGRPELREASLAFYCLSLSYVMFLVAIFFLNFGYFFYLPAATGIFVAVSRGAQREIDALKARQQQPVPALSSRPVQTPALRPAAAMAGPAISPPQRVYRFNRLRS